jgi:hypothetical protein
MQLHYVAYRLHGIALLMLWQIHGLYGVQDTGWWFTQPTACSASDDRILYQSDTTVLVQPQYIATNMKSMPNSALSILAFYNIFTPYRALIYLPAFQAMLAESFCCTVGCLVRQRSDAGCLICSLHHCDRAKFGLSFGPKYAYVRHT